MDALEPIGRSTEATLLLNLLFRKLISKRSRFLNENLETGIFLPFYNPA